MTDDEIDAIVRPLLRRLDSRWRDQTVYSDERALFRAGYAAGMEAAAKICDDDPGEMGEHLAAAILAAANPAAPPSP